MSVDDPAPIRPSAEWISRYAAGLLNSTPGLQPLDAVRRAMVASNVALGHPPKQPAGLRQSSSAQT